MKFTNDKLIIAGDYIHHYHYSTPISYDFTNPKRITTGKRETQESSEINALNSYRAKRAIKLLVQSNSQRQDHSRLATYKPLFITLTFKSNIDTLREANPLFKNFIKRFNYFTKTETRLQQLRYLVVPEFQKLTRNAVHYHSIFFNAPYIDRIYDTMYQLWGNGNINVQSVKNPIHLSNYIAKYITKTNYDYRMFNQKRYFTSRNVYRPQEIKNPLIVQEKLSVLSNKLWSRNYYIPELNQSLDYSCYRSF